jgi:ankyrin repeat protein
VTTPLIEQYAAQDDADMIALLVSRGADVAQCTRNGGTALHAAVRNDCSSAARALLQCGASPLTPDSEGRSCLDLAELLAQPHMLQMLLCAEVSGRVQAFFRESAERQQVCLCGPTLILSGSLPRNARQPYTYISRTA